MTQVIRISKAGYNAITETTPDNYIYSSQYNTLKYYASGSISLSITAGASPQNQEFDVYTHNLGYYPFFTAYVKINAIATYYNLPLGFADGGYWGYDFIYATTTKLIYRSEAGNIWGVDTTASTAVVYYKVFRNNLSV